MLTCFGWIRDFGIVSCWRQTSGCSCEQKKTLKILLSFSLTTYFSKFLVSHKAATKEKNSGRKWLGDAYMLRLNSWNWLGHSQLRRTRILLHLSKTNFLIFVFHKAVTKMEKVGKVWGLVLKFLIFDHRFRMCPSISLCARAVRQGPAGARAPWFSAD